MKNLKSILKTWNKEKFGDVNKKVNEAVKNLEAVQAQISANGICDVLTEQEQLAQIELNKSLHFQEEYWKEKSRISWHCHGDRNTAFFHRTTKIKHAVNKIPMLKNGSTILEKSEDIENHILDFYKDLFSTDNNCRDNGLVEEVIQPMVNDEDNSMLTKVLSRFEIKDAVFGMNADGAPGPDGFGGFFFQKYWDIVGKDVVHAVNQFFRQGWLLPNMNSNNIVLIPKTDNADSIGKYRPISLANYQFKLITKILADRLAKIVPKVISINQRGFISGRSITDCICVASEAINLLNRKTFGGNVALKIDTKKAFDTLDWNFLIKVLKSFGFDTVFCN